MMVKEEARRVFVLSVLLSHFELRRTPVSAAMAAETLQEIMSVALDMENMLNNMGVPERKFQQGKAPPISFDIPAPKPLREALLKLKVREETINRLNQIYISRVNEFRSKTTQELQILWRSLHVEGSHIPLRVWEKALLLAQRKAQKTLDDLFDMVISRARDHVANKKRKSQPVFDQVSIRARLFSVADWFRSALLIFSSGVSLVPAVRTPVVTKRRSSLFPLV
jgi:hypothetical protein